MKDNFRINEDGELEKFCPRCEEWWPADREFWYTTGPAGKGKLHSWCKACYQEVRNPRRRKAHAQAMPIRQ